jgi:hypothetical protein
MDRESQSCERKRSSHLNVPCYSHSVSIAETAYKTIRTPELSPDKSPPYLRNIMLTYFFQLGTFGRGKAKVEAMQKVIAEARRTQAAH